MRSFFRQWLIFSLLVLLPVLHVQAQQQALLDSLRQALHRPDDSARVVILCELCFRFGASDPDSALAYGKQALELARKLQHPFSVAQASNDLGMVYHRMGSYEKALELYQESLRLRKGLGNQRQIAASLSKIGNVYTDQGKYQEALKAQLSATLVFEQLNDQRAMAYSYNSLARLLELQKQFDQAIQYRQKALETARAISDRVGIAGALQGIAVNYQQKGQHNEAIAFFKESLATVKESGDKNNLAAALNNLGHAYNQTGQQDQAMSYFRQALEISEVIGDKQSSAIYRLNAADVYRRQNHFTEALKFARQALQEARAEKLRQLESEAYNTLSGIYSDQGNHEEAFRYLLRHEQVKDSLLNEASLRSIAEMQARYETEKKDNQIELLRRQGEIQHLALARHEAQRNLLALAVLVLVLLSAAGYLIVRIRSKQRLAKALLAEQEQRLKAVIETQETERRRIAEDLHDSLGQMLCLAKMNAAALRENYEPVSGQGALWTNLDTVVDRSITEVRSVAHAMMPSVLVKVGLPEALKELAEQYTSAGRLQVQLHLDELPHRLPEMMEVSLYRIVQELLSNTVKHAQATEVHLELLCLGQEIFMSVSDNGKGFDTKLIQHGRGNGWYNLHSRVALLQGQLQVHSEAGRGTRADVTVPLQQVMLS